MTAFANSGSSPTSPAPQSAKPWWDGLVHLLVRWRVRITVIVFAALLLEDVLEGLKPHDLTNFHDIRAVVGCSLVLAGLVLRSWAAGTLQKNVQLITSGPYGIIRNPLYIGSFLMMIGFCTIVDDAENIWFVLGPFTVLYVIRVLREEHSLSRKFGGQWQKYVNSVPRFFPRRFPRISVADWNLGQWLDNREYRAVSAVCLGFIALESWRLF